MSDPFPIKATMYFHGDKDARSDDLYDINEDLGYQPLDDDAQRAYIYAGYEIKVDVLINQNGQAYATHLNGVKLEQPVKV